MNKIYQYGIDYGTTNSSIALSIFKNETTITEVIDVEEVMPKKITPSRVLVNPNGTLLVGRDETKSVHRNRILRAIKMSIDPDSEFYDESNVFVVDGQRIEVVDTIAAILAKLREKADEFAKTYGIKVSGVVMGVPVAFGDPQKKILKQALVKAGFYANYSEAEKQTEFISEPVAVAVDYAEQITEDKNVLVFDFGGGTLDIAIMNLKMNVAMSEKLHPHEVLSKKRITLGGENLNEIFFVNCFCNENNYGLSYLKRAFGVHSNIDARQLWEMLVSGECGIAGVDFVDALENLKCTLSSKNAKTFMLKSGSVTIEPKTFSRAEFEKAIKSPLPGETKSAFDLIKEAVEKAIDAAGLDIETELDTILTAGGSSLIPCVQQYLYDTFPEQLHKDSGKTEKMTCIASGLSVIGCKEKEIIEDILDKDYGFWDVRKDCFEPVLKEGDLLQDLSFNKIHKRGKYLNFRKADPTATILQIDICQRTNANNQKVQKLDTIEILDATSNSYRIYMTVDEKQDILKIYLYDNEKKVWLDDQGKVSAKQCEYKLK